MGYLSSLDFKPLNGRISIASSETVSVANHPCCENTSVSYFQFDFPPSLPISDLRLWTFRHFSARLNNPSVEEIASSYSCEQT